MKKFLGILLSFTLILFNIQTAFAQDPNTKIEYFEDGSYCITIIEDCNDINITGIATASTSKTVSKNKRTHYYSSSNVELWYVQVTGSFTYGNGSAVCNSASVTAESKNKNWKISNRTSRKSGNSATASATGNRYSKGKIASSVTKSVTLTCSPTGKFS
ncbi:MAG: hypothetical protein HFH39_04270 [Lachnospiraceae bacterium]|nr:hypothetical protein [Lachnospiraceae bacterium]MCI9646251.1 hypothetical protein [Lachnospiraceae bacterium]